MLLSVEIREVPSCDISIGDLALVPGGLGKEGSLPTTWTVCGDISSSLASASSKGGDLWVRSGGAGPSNGSVSSPVVGSLGAGGVDASLVSRGGGVSSSLATCSGCGLRDTFSRSSVSRGGEGDFCFLSGDFTAFTSFSPLFSSSAFTSTSDNFTPFSCCGLAS